MKKKTMPLTLNLVLSVKDSKITLEELINKPLLNRDVVFMMSDKVESFCTEKVENGFTCFAFTYTSSSRPVQTIRTEIETLPQ
jgi:hypothetical protein